MTHARYLIGDTRAVVAHLPEGSVDLVLTSPPFLSLRSYLPGGHPDKQLEVGREATPADYLDALLDVIEALRRVLAPHGSLCLEVGDTYSGSGGGGGDYLPGGLRHGQPGFAGSAESARQGNASHWRQKNAWKKYAGDGRRNRLDDVAAGILPPTRRPGPADRDCMPGWPLDKSLCGIPTLLAWSLAYGRNLLRPERLTPRWRVRNLIVWCRPNPPVGRLADKVRPATSYLIVACTARDRYFDLEAIRHPNARSAETERSTGRRRSAVRGGQRETKPVIEQNLAGAPPLDYWVIPTRPYRGSHYAAWPETICVIPIKAMCPQRICTVCGRPSRRIVNSRRIRLRDGRIDPPRVPPTRYDASGYTTAIGIRHGVGVVTNTAGWTDCGHNAWRPGLVLDPFAGSGTTLAVATGHGHEAVGIDLDARNAQLAQQRVGPMFLTIEDCRPASRGGTR